MHAKRVKDGHETLQARKGISTTDQKRNARKIKVLEVDTSMEDDVIYDTYKEYLGLTHDEQSAGMLTLCNVLLGLGMTIADILTSQNAQEKQVQADPRKNKEEAGRAPE